MVAIISAIFTSCGSYSDDDEIETDTGEIIANLKSNKWFGWTSEDNVYSYGTSTYQQIHSLYFTSDTEGIWYVRIVDRDSALGTSRREEHIDFTYTIDGDKIRITGGGSTDILVYKGDYLMWGEERYDAKSLTADDESYISDHKNGYHGKEGEIDFDYFVIKDNEISKSVYQLDNGWYAYWLLFGFGAASDEAYKKGVTMMRVTIWADNGCLDSSYKTSNYRKRKTYTLYLSPTNKEWSDLFFVYSKETNITFNYELEYYNSKDEEWYEITSHKLNISK